MALCTVDYVRSKIHSSTLLDQDITDLIDEVTDDILAQCETTDESDPLIILAGKYATLAAVLAKMKTTGELAASVKTGNAQRQNTTDVEIERYETKSNYFISKYQAASSYLFSSPVVHTGFSSHCGGHHGHN